MFTLFAPTNEAFATLPQDQLQSLLMPENRERLQSILLYHVADGRYTAEMLQNAPLVTTLQGDDLPVTSSGAQVVAGEANVTRADIEARNGIIHVVDAVIMPPSGL